MSGGKAVAEKREQFAHALRVGNGVRGCARQRALRFLIGPRTTADAEIDAVRRERFEQPETFGDFERTVVRKQHAAAAEPDARRFCGETRDHQFRRTAREGVFAPVMLGEPIPVVA